jgi:Tol biopolymer transport system component
VFVHPRLSPDGRRVAVEVRAARGTDVWLYTRADRTLTRLTTDGSTDGSNDLPEWSPDGRRVIYRAMGRGGTTLRWVRADGSGEGGVLVGPDGAPYDGVFTPDGRTLVYRTQDRRSIVAVPLDGTGAPAGPGRPVVSSAFLTAAPRVSPDGRWLAYISDETGKAEVYVRAFPGPGPRAQVSSGGGGEPQWSRDGGAVYYRNGRALLAARLTTTPSLAVAGRDTLFTGGYLGDVTHPNYDVAPDGRGFLMLQAAADESETLVVHGWAHELRARLGGRRGER